MLLNLSLAQENATYPRMEALTGGDVRELQGVKLPLSMVEYVDPHWLSFPPTSQMDHLMLGVVYFFVFTIGTFGNGIVLYVFCTTKSLQTSSNLFIANLAVLDLVMLSQLPIFVVNCFYQEQVLGQLGCNLFGTLGAVSGMGAAVNNVVIAYDRHRSIANPMDGRMSMSHAAILVVFVWMWAMPFSMMPTFEIWNRYNAEGYLTTCSFDYLTVSNDVKVFTLAIFVYSYLIPVMLLVLFYARILGQVSEHQKMLREQAKKMGVKSLAAGKDDDKSAEIKIAKVACSIFFLFLAAWTPYATVALMGCFHSNRGAVLTPFASMVPAVFAKTVACIDPWIYAISHPKFREQCHKAVPFLISELPSPKAKSSGASETASTTTEEKA